MSLFFPITFLQLMAGTPWNFLKNRADSLLQNGINDLFSKAWNAVIFNAAALEIRVNQACRQAAAVRCMNRGERCWKLQRNKREITDLWLFSRRSKKPITWIQ